MRSGIIFAILMILVLVYSPHQVKATLGPCCEYAFVVSDLQPKPGERVDFTGVVSDQFGGGDPNVTIHYQDNAIRNGTSFSNSTTDANGGFYLSTTIPVTPDTDTIRFTLTMTDPTINWTATVGDSYPPPSGSPSGDFPALYNSQLGGRVSAYFNIQSAASPAIIYVSDGYDESLLHGVSSLDQGTTNFLTSLANKGFNVIAPIGWFVTDVPVFPYELAAMLKFGFHISKVYIIGWSAGGTVAAWILTHDLYSLFNLGVVMDAELAGASNQTSTNPSVFNTAESSDSVKVPHLLIWGMSDGGTTNIQSALLWAKHVQNNLARIDAFAYGHTWIGTNVEGSIIADVLAFFQSQSVGTLTLIQSDYGTARFLTDSQILNNNPYDARNKTYVFQITGQNGTVGSMNLDIPIASIDGQPVVLLDQNSLPATYSSDANNYYIFFTYTHSTHTILVVGQNNIPEFPVNARVELVALLGCMFMSAAFRKKTPKRP
jgi:hypothetical protein